MAASSRPCGVGWIETNPGFQTVPAFVVKFCDTVRQQRLSAAAVTLRTRLCSRQLQSAFAAVRVGAGQPGTSAGGGR